MSHIDSPANTSTRAWTNGPNTPANAEQVYEMTSLARIVDQQAL
jgi:hypothetical protein